MKKAALVILASAVMAGSPALADTHYMHCYGGGRAGLYFSAVFPVPEGVMSKDKAKAFDAFIQGKYHVTIFSNCQRDQSQANAASSKKMEEDADQTSKFPSKLIETGWAGK